MNKTQLKPKRSKFDYWRSHIENQLQSGLRQKEYCQENDLSLHTFRYWKSRVRKERQGPGKNLLRFVSITQSIENSDPLYVEVCFENMQVRIPAQLSEDQISKWIQALVRVRPHVSR